jgi:hypothetical protein
MSITRAVPYGRVQYTATAMASDPCGTDTDVPDDGGTVGTVGNGAVLDDVGDVVSVDDVVVSAVVSSDDDPQAARVALRASAHDAKRNLRSEGMRFRG